MWKHAAAIVVLIIVTACLFSSNDYIRYQEIRVEIEDKHITQDSASQEFAVILYKRDDGVVFTKRVPFSTWVASLPGEQKTIRIKELEMNPTFWGGFRYVFVPAMFLATTLTYLIMFLFGSSLLYPRKEKYV